MAIWANFGPLMAKISKIGWGTPTFYWSPRLYLAIGIQKYPYFCWSIFFSFWSQNFRKDLWHICWLKTAPYLVASFRGLQICKFSEFIHYTTSQYHRFMKIILVLSWFSNNHGVASIRQFRGDVRMGATGAILPVDFDIILKLSA